MKYRPELDGLRAVSMLLVVVYHLPLDVPWLRGGFVGVDVFFVLSGALITRLLLIEEARTGTLALPRFYWRRMRRLYPAMIAMIAVTVLVSLFVFPRHVFPVTLRDGGLSAAYLGVLPALWGKVRFFGHTWSLSLEELFYLAWPALLLAMRGRRARILFLALVIVACQARTLELWFVQAVPSQRIWVALDTRAGTIALGCLVGIAAHEKRLPERLLVRLAPIAALGILALARTGDRTMTWYAVWGYPAAALASAIVVARLFAAPSRVFSFAPLVELGRHSYAMYLWHVPALTVGDALGWPIALSISVAFALAWITIYWERRLGTVSAPLPPRVRAESRA